MTHSQPVFPTTILASASPWRQKIFSWLNLPFQVMVSHFDESSVTQPNPAKLARILAVSKARQVATSLPSPTQPCHILSADTLVVIQDQSIGESRLLGKPHNISHARSMLQSLRGQRHQVITSVALLSTTPPSPHSTLHTQTDISYVTFHPFSDQQLENYLSTGESVGKAGAFGILGSAIHLISQVEGSISGIIGLPLKKTTTLLHRVHIHPPVDLQSIIHQHLLTPFYLSNPSAILKVSD